MKAKKLAEILLKNPEAKVTLSVSNENLHFFADKIIEVTEQGEKQLTIVADINKNDFIYNVSPRFSINQKIENIVTKDKGVISAVDGISIQHLFKVKWNDGDITTEIGSSLNED